MSLVVRDYLRRWAWAYLLGFACHVAAMSLAWIEPDSVVLASVFAGSAFILMWETTRSRGSRTMLALPMSSRDLARVWRFVALDFPTLWYLLALVLSAVIIAIFGPEKSTVAGVPMLTAERFVILAWLQTVVLGMVFFGFTGIPVMGGCQPGLRAQVRGGLYGLVWGFSIPVVMLGMRHVPESFAEFETLHWTVAAVLSLFTVLGWMRAEDLVMSRAHYLRANPSQESADERKKNDRASIRSALAGPCGLWVNFVQFASTIGPFGLVILLFNFGMMEMMSRGEHPLGDRGAGVAEDQIGFFMPIFALIAGLTIINQLRVLKTVPLDSRVLAAILVLWPLTVGAGFGLASVFLHGLWYGGMLPWEKYEVGLLACGFMVMIVPLILRFGLGWKSFLAVFLLLPAIQLAEVFSDTSDWSLMASVQVPGAWKFIVALLLIAISWWLSCRVLSSSHPWREGAMRLKSQRRF